MLSGFSSKEIFNCAIYIWQFYQVCHLLDKHVYLKT
ncbi:hypothetical protein SAMN05428977_106110 [Nitrosomonas sp. Nm166]|nr:hypothetical protein SAMN05428977_106110 [Nitrosomonas sp. Nm166]